MPNIQIPNVGNIRFPDSMSPDEINAAAKKLHDEAVTPQGPKEPLSQVAARRKDPNSPGNVEATRIIGQAAQDEKNLYGRAAKQGAMAVAAGVAAPFTGGMSLLPALGVAGMAGAAGGVTGELAKSFIGSNEVPKTASQMALTLGLDTGSFVAGEGAGRLIGYVGKTLLPKLIVQNAAKSTAGAQALKDAYTINSRALYDEIDQAAIRATANATEPVVQTAPGRAIIKSAAGDHPPLISERLLAGETPPAPGTGFGAEPAATGSYKADWMTDVGPQIKSFYDKLKGLPRLSGKLGQEFGGLTSRAASTVSAIEKDLVTQGGAISTAQPLKGLIRAQHALQQAAYATDSGLATEEGTIFRETARDLQKVIYKELEDAGPAAKALYEKTNNLVKIEAKNNIAKDLAARVIQSITRRTVMSAIGGGTGYFYGGHGWKGAAAGALIANGMPQVSAFILKQTLAHPNAGPLMAKAVNLAFEGKGGPAGVLAARAMTVAGARQTLRDLPDQTPQDQAPDQSAVPVMSP